MRRYIGIQCKCAYEILSAFLNPYSPPYSLKSNKLAVSISDIEELKLSDGTIIVENGVFTASYKEDIKRSLKYKNVSSAYTMTGCGIFRVVALGGLYLYFVHTFNLGMQQQQEQFGTRIILLSLELIKYFDKSKNKRKND